MKKLFTLFLLLILGTLTFSESVALKVGDKIPNFGLISINKNKNYEIRDFKGKELLINFTASWCPTCIEEKLSFQKDYEKSLSKNSKIETIIIFGDYGKETITTAKNYLKENKYTYPSYYDKNKEIASLIGLKSVPTSILVDKDGTILEIASKYSDLNLLKNKLK